jgi:disulfide bond formation protein DsbB
LGSLLLFINKWEKKILIIILLFFIFGSIISIYHLGIEQGIFSESLLCELGLNNNIQNPDELLKTLKKTPVSCKDVTFKIFGLSLATFNAVLSIVISCILFKLIFIK